MTAEIAILNKSAVALAADSKVTITSGAQSKGYDSANKVFTLSKVHPVGIMVFGNAEFMQYPWETIIKIYRNQKKLKSETYIAEWADDFIGFLKNFGKITKDDIAQNINSVLTSWFASIERDCLDRAQEAGISALSPEFINFVKSRLKQKAAEIQGTKFVIEAEQFQELLENHKDTILNSIYQYFTFSTDSNFFEAAIEFSVAALCGREYSPQSSGFVIAGFGDDEYFPTLIEFDTDGYIGANIKISISSDTDVSRNESSAVHAFAQKDMVQRFMMGVDPRLFSIMQSAFATALHDSCLSVLDEYGREDAKNDAVKQEIVSAISDRVSKVIGNSNKYMGEKFVDPIIKMVAVLPKDELAHLAESLVALTSLQRKVSNGLETVGGPIDVALISKGDGFVWIKRKHYFKSELNQHFTRNYMRSVGQEEESDA